MKKDDAAWVIFYAILCGFSVYLTISGGFAWLNGKYPYPAGFVQFALYATAGELLSNRILEGAWTVNRALWFKSASWGTSGLFVTLSFRVFSEGTARAMEAGLLPFAGNVLATAFFTSAVSNLFFGPLHAALIRVCSNYADLGFTQGQCVTVREAVNSVDWGELVDFTLFKTIPFFWIPVNTISFLLPVDYRIAMAAMLSMAFGVLMTILKLRERKNQSR